MPEGRLIGAKKKRFLPGEDPRREKSAKRHLEKIPFGVSPAKRELYTLSPEKREAIARLILVEPEIIHGLYVEQIPLGGTGHKIVHFILNVTIDGKQTLRRIRRTDMNHTETEVYQKIARLLGFQN